MSTDGTDSTGTESTGTDVLDPTGVLRQLSGILQSSEDLTTVFEDIAALAKDTLPGAHEVSVTLVQGGRAETVASTGELAVVLDERQYDAGWGPCLDAADSGDLLYVEDTATETRWPVYCSKATELGVRSSLSAAMPTQQEIAGALNVYATAPSAMSSDDRELARSFADHAALAITHAHQYSDIARQAQTLREAMRSRAVIEQAKGIFMAARQCGPDEAFDVLVRLSQTRHIKLRDVAAQVVSQASGQEIAVEQD
jgi:GAF domain-containing protein